jgi:putative ATP-binding cassette transporter
MAYNLRMTLCRRILSAPYKLMEDLGPQRIMATLTEDIPTVTTTLGSIPLLCMNLTIILGCLLYLGWLSPLLLMVVIGFIGFGLVTYQLPVLKAMKLFRLLREEWDTLHKHFRALANGGKELKLHRPRREAFLNQSIEVSSQSLLRASLRGNTIYSAATSWGQILAYVLIGLLLFGAPGKAIYADGILTGYVLTILYMMSPLGALLNMFPNLGRASVAIQKVKQMGLSLESQPADVCKQTESPWGGDWRQIELADVTHTYRRVVENGNFTMGPINMTIRRGEVVFITGGNGSGKTTLAKVLTGLYAPEGGEIFIDRKPITDDDRDEYRQLFSAVFSDNYVFDTLLGLDEAGLDDQANRYLNRFELDHKVQIDNGAFSTVNLSQGQRKRLALLTAYIEDRPIYVFDEWAAEQDPHFKWVFYKQILPELKLRGKAVIVITHDDRYFDEAERVIKLDYGRIQFDGPGDQMYEHSLSVVNSARR